MNDESRKGSVRRSPNTPPSERRRSKRLPVPGVFVAIEAPEVAGEAAWAGSAIDINGDGLALSLPPEVDPGNEVRLTFRLSDGAALASVPAVVLRKNDGHSIGAVKFLPWPEPERLALLSFLLNAA